MRISCCQNESELLLKISKGDEDAFNKIVDHYTPLIYATALAYIKIVEGAEDATQEVFYKVWKNRAKLSEVTSFKDYLFVITRNEVLSSLRKKGPSYPLGEYLDSTLKEKNLCPGDTLSLRQLQQALQRAVTMLPPQQKQAYLLSREEGLQHNEIAEKMNLSRSTVKNHIIAALNFIRQYVQDNADVVFLLIAFLIIC
jgi:RNA polymerase sigma-70 factor (family 1)